jgi:hypothetical protein
VISIYGDESSSAEFATYGLLAISDADLPALAIAVKRAKALLKSNGDEQLHSKVLFHSGLRGKSSFKHASIADVEKACAFVIAQVSMFQTGFYFGRVDRRTAPKKLYVPLTNSKNSSEVLLATLELELPHLQWNAYGAAATRACKTLREPPYRVVVDHNKTIIRWFNESRQAGRLVELMWMDSTLPKWPTPTLANDTDHPGLQVVDILTYYATKQLTDPRFVMPFDSIRAKTHFMLHVFEPDVCRPYVAPPGVTVKPFPKKPNPDRMGTGSTRQATAGRKKQFGPSRLTDRFWLFHRRCLFVRAARASG